MSKRFIPLDPLTSRNGPPRANLGTMKENFFYRNAQFNFIINTYIRISENDICYNWYKSIHTLVPVYISSLCEHHILVAAPRS